MTRALRQDLQVIADLVEKGQRVLDIGCEDGALLEYLVREKAVVGRGMELSQAGVNASVNRGLSVVQGDADRDLKDYPDDAFDVAILSQTLQATQRPDQVLAELVRIGRRAIVSFPNFGHWSVRASLAFGGRMPVTKSLPDAWFDTPNIHFCTLRDFVELAKHIGVKVESAWVLDKAGRPHAIGSLGRANFFGRSGLFVLRRG